MRESTRLEEALRLERRAKAALRAFGQGDPDSERWRAFWRQLAELDAAARSLGDGAALRWDGHRWVCTRFESAPTRR